MESPSQTTGPLQNLIGTGKLSREEEGSLLDRGIQFAAYFHSSGGPCCLVTSKYRDLYQRLGEQLERLYDEAHGFPVKFRLPTDVHSDTSPSKS